MTVTRRWCSDESVRTPKQEYHHRYYLEHRGQFQEYRRRWRVKVAASPDLKERRRTYERERYRSLSPEQKAEKNRARADQRLVKKFGLTPPGYERLLGIQGGCAICGRQSQKNRRLAVDHSHATGEVRGILCDLCNRGLGVFQEDVNILRAAIAYLEGRGGHG
jgi:hypothetical protein